MNEANTTGNNNIIFQGINESTITVNVNGHGVIPKLLTSAPFQSSVFEGRETALQEVHDLLFGINLSDTSKVSGKSKHLLMLVNGQGGIGKTTFAAKYWQKYEDEYINLAVLYVGNGIANALTNREFTNNLGIVFPEKATEEEKLEIVFGFLTTKISKPSLLILDNANDAEDLGKYAMTLGKCSNLHILLTSRLENFANTQKYALGALDKGAALNVFQQNYEYYEPTDEKLFYEIFLAVGGNTLVMELLAKNLNNFNRNKQHYSLQNLHEDLKKSLLNLSKSKEVNTAYQAQGTGLRNEKPEVIILAMYDLSELTEAETALLSAFAVLPPENIAFASLETLLKSKTLENSLEKLTQKGWIEFDNTTKSYKVSPVVQEITRYKNKERLFGDCEEMIDFLIDELNWQANADYHKEDYKLTSLYSHYAESIVAIFVEPSNHTSYHIGVLCQRIGYFYQTTGNLSKMLDFYENYFKINEQVINQNPDNPNYKNDLAISYQNLGNTHSTLGNLDKALEYFIEMNNLFKELYAAYPTNVKFKNSLAVSYVFLGITYSSLGNLKKALAYYTAYNTLEQELYAAYPTNVSFKNGLAISYAKLGEIHSSLRNLDKALEYFIEMNNLFKELYATYPTNVDFKNSLAISYQHLGNIYSNLDNLDKALAFYEKDIELSKELYAAYPTNVSFKNGLAISYSKLGDLHRNMSKKEKILFLFSSSKGKEYKQKAKFYYLESQKLLVELVQISPAYVEFQKNLKWVENRLAEL